MQLAILPFIKLKTMANKTVIEGSDRVKASQLKELFRLIDENIINGEMLQKLIEYPLSFKEKPTWIALDRLLLLIMKGDDRTTLKLTLGEFRQWKDVLLYSANQYRNWVDSLRPDDNYHAHFRDCWEKLDAAKNDEELSAAVSWLGLTMYTK